MKVACPSACAPLLALPPIGLRELDAKASLQDRVDVKYIVTLAQLDALVERLAATHRALEIDGRRAFGYRTTYYDTDDLLTFREHVQQRRRRFKCRKRSYVDSGRSVFEVKLKGPRGRTVKHAIACCPADELTDDEAAFLDANLLRAYGRRVHGALAPTLTATCRRSTIAAPELGERLTCDLGLDFGGGRLEPRLAILESKSPLGMAAADRALRSMGVRPVQRCSKYPLGMALIRGDLRDNDLRPLLRRYFVATPERRSASASASRSTT
jgi:hypothetical protein